MAEKFITGISLNDVRELIDERNIGEDAADAVGKLLGLVIAIAPALGGPVLLPLLELIEPKNELIEFVKYAAKKISRSKPADYLDRMERMAAANCLLVYAAYFDTLRKQWPSIIRDLHINEEEAKKAFSAAAESMSPSSSSTSSTTADLAIAIPHPADPRFDKRNRLETFTRLTAPVDYLLTEMLHLQDRLSRGRLDRWIDALLARAESLYQAEYLGMAVEFQQFFIWGVLQDRAAKDGQIQQLAEDQRTWFELLGRATYSLDLGLKDLTEAIARLPRPALSGTAQSGVQAVAEGLHRTYADVLQKQVIDDQFTVDDTGPRLGFPRKVDGFIPQAYRVTLYRDRDTHLEREDAWQECEVGADIGAFILRYLESSYSVRTPLLILGHPGSGKSLLTEVLAGQLAYPSYTTVRVKLRDVDPDVGLLTQLQNQIQNDTGGRSITWADFAVGLSACPPVVILDGYDELLQATGKVFASYLDEIGQFQHQQALHHQPVRVIVTSRLTLIDKAAIPVGTTVVKLEDFDQERRDAWCEIWNRHNESYFQQTEILPFSVPANQNVLELARQPLLLLMLAIYDSLGNELSSQPDIDQTLLYDRLLRRFIERELSKGKAGREFAALSVAAQAEAIDSEMGRLGVAAIGMFNRQDVKIHREELNADLRYFGAEKATTAEGRVLAEADLLLGSFFFIHESRSKLQEEAAGPDDGRAAFEFLHNTFGEFLAADFILRRAVEEASMVCRLSGDSMLDGARGHHLATLSGSWFGSLIHTALHTRPVILGMIREWGRHRIGREPTRADMLAAFDAIVTAQLRTVLNDLTIPEPQFRQRGLSPYGSLPMRGHLAVYSLNLVLLRTYLADEDYVLDEKVLGSRADSCRPWDGLTNLWRSWFTLDGLSMLAASMTATRNDQRIAISECKSWLLPPSGSPLRDLYRTAVALADNATAASAGLHVAPLTEMPDETFPGFWTRVEDAIPELSAVADVLALKMFAANGDALRAVDDATPIFPGPLPDVRTSPAGSVDYVDVEARLTRTPPQWCQVSVNQDGFETLVPLSRYEAEATVDSRVRLDPSWLPSLFSARELEWSDFLRRPAAAPVLRAAVRELVPAQFRHDVTWAAKSQQDTFDVFDIDTASALAVFSFLGDSSELYVLALAAIIENCDGGVWRLLDIPTETWERLADLFRSADPALDVHRDRFRALLEAAVTESVHSLVKTADDVRALAPFWVQALRIGVDNADLILEEIDQAFLPRVPEFISGWERKCIMSLIRWAHETGDPSPVFPLLRLAGDGVWLSRFLGSQNPEAVDGNAVARILTHQEAMDLRWALEALNQSDQKEGPTARRIKDRQRR